LDVIVPSISQVKFDKYDIYDKDDMWKSDASGDNIACFKQGIASNVKEKFDDSDTLTFDTTVQLRADVHFLDEYITGEDYDRTDVTFSSGTWATEYAVNSEATAQAAIKDDYDVDMQWRYQVKSPNGTDDWISTGDVNNIRYYLVWDDPKGASSIFVNEVIAQACDYAEGDTSTDSARSSLMDEMAGDYEWDMDCNLISSAFVRQCLCLGINASLHRWASNASRFGGTVGDMCYQRTNTIDPIGSVWGSEEIDWSWHQWAESDGKQYDPSANAIFNGTWGEYEDDLFKEYKRCVTVSPNTYSWDANQTDQNNGCESRGIHTTGDTSNWNSILTPWLAPNR
jgi:hypothetical protein